MFPLRGLRLGRDPNDEGVVYRRPWISMLLIGAFLLYLVLRLLQMGYWLLAWIL